jgi:hypothetical protein
VPGFECEFKVDVDVDVDGLDEVAFGAGCTCASALEEGMVEFDMVVWVSLGKSNSCGQAEMPQFR